MAWTPCPCCEGFLCSRHGIHAHDCPCPPIEEWETDPYATTDPQANGGDSMSNAKHSPGPWTVDGTVALGAYGVWTENPDPRNPGHDGAGYSVQICSMNPHDRDTPIGKDERGANARLIAVSPRMLAACKRFGVLDCDPHATEADWSQFRRDVAAVIADAEDRVSRDDRMTP